MLYSYLPLNNLFKRVNLLCTLALIVSCGIQAQDAQENFSEYPCQQESSSRMSSNGPFSSKPFNGDDFIDQAGPPVDNDLPIEDYAWILIPFAGALVIQFRKKLF